MCWFTSSHFPEGDIMEYELSNRSSSSVLGAIKILLRVTSTAMVDSKYGSSAKICELQGINTPTRANCTS